MQGKAEALRPGSGQIAGLIQGRKLFEAVRVPARVPPSATALRIELAELGLLEGICCAWHGFFKRPVIEPQMPSVYICIQAPRLVQRLDLSSSTGGQNVRLHAMLCSMPWPPVGSCSNDNSDAQLRP